MIDRIHGGNCLKQNIIDFSVNTNPLGLPEGIKDIISENADCILRYPDPSSERLKRKLAALHYIRPENIAVGNGSIELIYLIPRAFKIKKSLIAVPTFSEYEFALKSNGSKPIFFNTSEGEDFKVDAAKIARSSPRSGAIFLCNPNNPTGSLLSKDEISRLINLCRDRGIVLIIDEAFIEFTEESKNTLIISSAVKNGSLVILRSLTKFFAIPGLRLGYAVGHERMIAKITKLQYPWNVNGPAQLAGEAVLADRGYMDRTRIFVAKERKYMFERLDSIKALKVYPSSANFILCKLQDAPIQDSKELKRRLLREGICIRDCGNFRGLNNNFFRVAVRKRNDNTRLLNSMEKVFR